MARNLARDCQVSIVIDTPDGQPPSSTWAAPTDITGFAKEVTLRQTGNMVDVSGLSDEYPRKRVGQWEHVITINYFSSNQQFPFHPTTASPVGYKARVDIKPRTTLAQPYSYYGIITRWEWSTSSADAQVYNIEIEASFDD